MNKMKTPEEAKDLCCPHFKAPLGWANTDGNPVQRCISDKCMMWQWGEKTRYQGGKDHKTGNEGKGYCSLTSVKD